MLGMTNVVKIMKTPWLSLATLAAADTGRVYCVVPSRWPPSRSLEAVASTWLKDCDVVTIAVSGRQYTRGCWSGEAYGFHGKPLKNHFLVTHFYRALAGK